MIQEAFEQYIEERLGITRRAGSSGDREYVIPECPECGDTKGHFYVNIDKKLFHCYKCGFAGTLTKLVARIEGISEHQAKEMLMDQLRPVTTKAITEIIAMAIQVKRKAKGKKETAIDVPLPDEFIPCFNKKTKQLSVPVYLKQRDVNPQTLAYFGVGYAGSGPYKGTVIWPIHTGESRTFVARVAGDVKGRKYLYPENAPIGRFVFNYNKVKIGEKLIIAEGAMDVMRLWLYGYNAVGLLGKNMTNHQLRLILMLNPSDVVIMLDNDALDQANKLASAISGFVPVKVAVLDSGDPDSASRDDIEKAINSSYNPHSIQALMIKAKKIKDLM